MSDLRNARKAAQPKAQYRAAWHKDMNRPERVKQMLIVWGIRGRHNRVVTAAINRNTGKPHEHRREIARRTGQPMPRG